MSCHMFHYFRVPHFQSTYIRRLQAADSTDTSMTFGAILL